MKFLKRYGNMNNSTVPKNTANPCLVVMFARGQLVCLKIYKV